MRKLLNNLTPDDFLFYVRTNEIAINKSRIKFVDSSEITINYGNSHYGEKIKRDQKHVFEFEKIKFFVNETDAIRYAKSNLMKELFSKIEIAKKAIDDVKSFRYKNHELLNHDWTEMQINKLEKEIRQ